jgi:hypothetical protein
MANKPLKMLSYARATADAMLSDIVKYMTQQFGQSTTNFTVASAYGQIVFVLSNITQMVLYYIESSITEMNINTATRPQNIQGLVTLAGHQPTRAIAAEGSVSLYIQKGAELDLPGGQIIIPNGTKISCTNNGMQYMVDLPGMEMRMPMDGSKNGMVVNLVQGYTETQTFTGTGKDLQSISVNFPNAYRIDNNRVDVYVNGTQWKKYDSLYDMPYQGKCFIVKNSPVGSGVDVFFGTGSFGLAPQSGAEIVVEYLVSNGTAGNLSVPEGEVVEWQWVDSGLTLFGEDADLNKNLGVKLVVAPDFGTDPESLELTKLIGPRTSRSYVLANPTNYITYFERFNQFSIIDVYQTKDDSNLKDDKILYALLVPDVRKTMQSNENYFSIPESRFLLTSTQKNTLTEIVNRSGSKVVSTELSFVDVKFSRFVLNIAVILYDDAIPEVVKSKITENVADYFLNIRRRDRIPQSDIIRIVEGIDGVDSVNASFVSEIDEQFAKAKATSLGSSSAAVKKQLPRIDDFGDILIYGSELPVIRGGWSDRNSIAYEKSIDDAKPSAVNIIVKSVVAKSYNSEMNAIKINKLSGKS